MTEPRQTRADYVYFETMTTRWMDNDAYRHINNVVYYSFFDTIANNYLMKAGDRSMSSTPANTIG